MATLTPEQRQEILRAGEEPVRFADPETQTEYVILRADIYDRISALAEDVRAAYPLAMKVFGQDGWDDPQMDEYNVLDPRMTVNRGDVVLVDYPFTTGGAKVRPALVVQNDRDNARMTNTIVAQISGNTTRVNEATQHLIELAAEPGCGLARDSALIATNLLTMQQSDILRVLGSLSAATMSQVDDYLRIALGLP